MQYRFIALDLETTGLDPKTDTIIEVAAISFSLEQLGENLFVNIEDKRTMLINPERKLVEEVVLITGITNEMLVGRPLWNEVRDRVADFIGEDTVIVGHNVLFDVAMFATHGINLEDHVIIDTFELSELFSQDMESLNLWFLSGQYRIKTTEWEHRALGDTHLSIGLFERYVNEAKKLDEIKKSILRLMAEKEKTPSMSIFNEIIKIDDWVVFSPENLPKHTTIHKTKTGIATSTSKSELCYSLDGNRETETDFLLSMIERYGKVEIIAPNKKVQTFLTTTLREYGCKAESVIETSRFCSLEELWDAIGKDEWERKESIFIGKLLWWLQDTETGFLEELNFYGEEREYIRYFRAEDEEYSHFRERYENKLRETNCIVNELGNFVRNRSQIENAALIIKDIPLIEDAVRKNGSILISIDELTKDLRSFPDVKNLLYTLYLIIDLYEHVPERPTGINQFPPGDFGETYFFSQTKLWETKGKWLVLFSKLLSGYYTEWKEKRIIHTRMEKLQARNIDTQISTLIQYGLIKEVNTWTIIHISEWGTTIRFIPKNVAKSVRELIINEWRSNTISYGYKLDSKFMKRFLVNECGIFEIPKKYIEWSSSKKYLSLTDEPILISPWSVVLATSQRQIREYGKMLRELYTDTPILIQWISWGKWKILSLFLDNPEKSILIGLIDTWKDEFELWKNSETIHILKLPFDPPSDPYFLARTVGMSDNFAHYSQPMAVVKINTLIGRIRSVGYRGMILCHDARLMKTTWGQEIAMEIL